MSDLAIKTEYVPNSVYQVSVSCGKTESALTEEEKALAGHEWLRMIRISDKGGLLGRMEYENAAFAMYDAWLASQNVPTESV